jgi:hypothetical protein
MHPMQRALQGGMNMNKPLIIIETDEWIYWEYEEA